MLNISECTKRPILTPCDLKGFDYQVDTYVGCEHYCYYCYALANAETDWSREIQVHSSIVDQLKEELADIPPQTIYMGYQTDPYQPCEARLDQTRQVLALLAEKGFSASILTKSDLVLRDIDILCGMKDAAVSVSVAFNSNKTRQLFEANTMDTEKRIEALSKLKKAGVETGSLLCPVIPYITDPFPLVDALQPCADVIWIYGLSIKDRSGQNWQYLQEILNNHFSDLIHQIEPAIFSNDHPYWTQLREGLEGLKKERQLNLNIHL